jgi:RND family efflux transporter MFP subunit
VISMNRHSTRREPAIATVISLAVTISLAIPGCDSRTQAAVAAASPETPTISTTPPASAPAPQQAAFDSKSYTTTGPLVAERQADVAAERDGRVVSVSVQIGDHVQTGQLLAQLDDRALHAACDAKAARVASAQASVREWEAEELSARASLRRADSMRADKIISEEDWEHVKYRVDETVAEVARYRSEETAAEADSKVADLQLEQSRIVAPISGVVGRSSALASQEVKSGDVLFWITAEAPLHVLFTVPELVMAVFTAGKPLDLTTADYPGLHQRGRILRVSPVVDPASGSVQVIGEAVDPSPLLKPGMQMQVRLAP